MIYRFIRGGSYFVFRHLRPTDRNWNWPENQIRRGDVGFRLVVRREA